ncbi:MAG TPA: amidohydrolase [Bacteroidales bacterium]|nr:amidohydrolase [Bacteroidales bacterium]
MAEREKLSQQRRQLHQHPELSGKETDTVRTISTLFQKLSPDEFISGLGGNGAAFIFNGNKPGKTILFRSELDALPIEEINTFDYRSKQKGVAHKCGHDGHMVILTGLAQKISSNRGFSGRVIFLFQPAEETGEGARLVLEDKKFKKLKPDYVFALHNLPGFNENSIVVRKSIFTAASKGMVIKLPGKTSHAAEPEKGINPAKAVSKILEGLIALSSKKNIFEDFTLITIVHTILGEIAFGTSAGYAEIRATLRSYSNQDMEKLTLLAEELVNNISKKEGIVPEISYQEEFPACENHSYAVNVITEAADKLGLETVTINIPFKWSEDFGWFLQQFPGAIFGLGAGKKHPALHNPDYDFPDAIISAGVEMFFEIANQLTNK